MVGDWYRRSDFLFYFDFNGIFSSVSAMFLWFWLWTYVYIYVLVHEFQVVEEY